MASIEHRVTRSGKVWRVRFRVERAQKVVTFTDPKRAEAWCALVEVDPTAALALLDETEPEAPIPTLAEMVSIHIGALTGVTQGTVREYQSYLKHSIEPHPISRQRVDLIDRPALAGWVQWLESKGMAGKTIANRHGLVSATMATAVELGHVTGNPCRGMRLPRTTHEQVEHCYLTPAEVQVLLDAVGERYRPLFLTLVGTGMRFGEATALQVGDVDVGARSIRISRAWKRTGGAVPELGPTKTLRADRVVVVPPQVLAAILPLMEGRAGSDLLFTSARGGPVRQSSIWRHVWQPAVWALAGDDVGMVPDSRGRPERKVVRMGPGKHPRIHDLRHTFASWAISNNIPLPVIQRQLGHEKITTTIDTYGHLARSDFDALALATSAMLPALDRPEPPAVTEL